MRRNESEVDDLLAKREGHTCSCCNKLRLVVVRGALVCPTCDGVKNWRGT